MNTQVDLLDLVRTHLAEFELPALWSINITTAVIARKVSVQLDCDECPKVAGALLAWADTLSEVTAEVWQVPRGDSVHLSVIGRLSDGTKVHVYGGVPSTEFDLVPELAHNARTTIPLAVLRAMATPGEAIL